MPTVQEILLQSGFTPEEIAAFDAKKINAFGGVLTTAEAERKAAADALTKAEETRKTAETAEKNARERADKAELVERSNKDFYEGTIVTALNGWDDTRKTIEQEKAKAIAEAAFYKTQAEEAKKTGFIAADAPAFSYVPPTGNNPAGNPTQTRDPNGRYVTNAPGSTPGSPSLVDDVRTAFSDSTWAMQEHQRLFGTFLPDDVTLLAREADGMKMNFRDYVARKYSYPQRREDLQRQAQEKHDTEVRQIVAKEYEDKLKASEEKAKTELEKARTEWAERTGNNPDVRTTGPSQMAEVNRAVKGGQRPDPLTLNARERHGITRKQINERIATQENAA